MGVNVLGGVTSLVTMTICMNANLSHLKILERQLTYIQPINWLPIYTHYGEHTPIVEVNAHHIKSYVITNRVFMVPVEVWEAEDKARYERNLAMRGEKNGD